MHIETLYLLRHGETNANRAKILVGKSEEGLSERGRFQAQVVADYLIDIPLDILYSSPQIRAVETAGLIAKRINVKMALKSELIERNYGPYDGLTREQLITQRRKDGLCIDDPTQDWYNAEGVESDEMIWRRVYTLIETSSGYKHILMVTHAGIVKSILHRIFEIPHHRHNCFKILNGTLVVLKNVESGFELGGLLPTVVLSKINKG